MSLMLGRPFDLRRLSNSDIRAKIRAYLYVAFEERTEKQIFEIAEFLKENSFFARFAGSGLLLELCRYVKIKKFAVKDVIIDKDDDIYILFLIYSGRLRMIADKAPQKDYIVGQYFGDYSLLDGIPLNATVISLENSEIIILKRVFFDQVTRKILLLQYQNNLDFFKSLPAFSNLSEDVIKNFAKRVYLKKFPANHNIIQEGDYTKGIYILVEGTIKLYHRLEIAANEVFNYRSIVIDELGPGDILCEHAYITKQPVQYTATTLIPIICYYIDRDDLRGFNLAFMQEFKTICKPYPNDDELKKELHEKKR